MWWKPKAKSDARVVPDTEAYQRGVVADASSYFRKHPVRGYFAHLHPAYLLPDTEAYQRGIEARRRGEEAAKLVDDPKKLAARVAHLECVVAENPTDSLSRAELKFLLPALKAEQKAALYTQAWADG